MLCMVILIMLSLVIKERFDEVDEVVEVLFEFVDVWGDSVFEIL